MAMNGTRFGPQSATAHATPPAVLPAGPTEVVCRCDVPPVECKYLVEQPPAVQASDSVPQPPHTGCDKAGKYDLSHLVQEKTQDVVGPIQVSALNAFVLSPASDMGTLRVK